MKPNVGMVYPVAAAVDTYTAGSGITYDDGFVVSEARGATLTWNTLDGEFYGDDALLDTDNSVTGYTIDFEATGLSDTVRGSLLGEVEGSADEMVITGAPAPEVGFGYVRVMRDNSSGTVQEVFEGWWFYRIRFARPNEEARTKENSIEWRAPTISGKGMGVYLSASDDYPNFVEHKSFTSLSAAKAYLNAKAGISDSETTSETTEGATT